MTDKKKIIYADDLQKSIVDDVTIKGSAFAAIMRHLQDAPAVQEWISVKDRLPEDVYGKDREQIVVLVCTKSGKVSQCARMADYECIADASLTKVEWIKNGKFYWSKGKNVTHWMPLPQPPKGE